jgi:hypothetical protein
MNKAERELFHVPNVQCQRKRSGLSQLIGDKLLRDVRDWLSPPDPWTNHNLARESRHSGTGNWWIRGDAYAKWKSSGPNSLLWIHGKRQYSVAVFYSETNYYCLSSGRWKERHLVG